MIKAIFAIDKNYGMGKSGSLPWPKDSEDLKWFKSNTQNQIVVMGSKTWCDPFMPSPLPNRINVVVSAQDKAIFDKANMVIRPVDLTNYLKNLDEMNKDTDVWIIGGPTVLHTSKPLIQKIYLTVFHDIFDCDVFLDNEYLNKFKLIKEIPGDNKTFKIYNRL